MNDKRCHLTIRGGTGEGRGGSENCEVLKNKQGEKSFVVYREKKRKERNVNVYPGAP